MSELVRVSAQSRTTAVAGAIAGIMRERGYVEVQAIGAGAVNQAIKSITIARSYLVEDQMDLAVVPSFHTTEIEGAERTAIHFAVFRRPESMVAEAVAAAPA
ncbi:MAG: stage V sporulation protein S [Anaerolineales bacterium]|nr:stage V sporulation protein S [Anaerolineales bacterium]